MVIFNADADKGSVMPDPLPPHGLNHARLFCLWEFSRHEYWSGLPFPSPENLRNSGMEPGFLASAALAGRFFTTSTTWEALKSEFTVPCKVSQEPPRV